MAKEIISLSDLLTSSGKYSDRANSSECTQTVKDNGAMLINKVNQLLTDLGIDEVSVSSGFRTSAANSALANAAKKSHHCTGNAVDLLDTDGKLDALLEKNITSLEKYGLYLESPKSTIGWCHIQDIKTHNNPFIP